MDAKNTPTLEGERLLLRRFTPQDIPALLAILGEERTNTFLPWFPLRSLEEAEVFFRDRYAAAYRQPRGYHYAICLKCDNIPIGYLNLGADEPHDLGYGLREAFWHQGIVTEAARLVVAQAKRDGLPFITATHDRENPRSGAVMQRLGMVYRYSYQEQWQPKDIPVVFRLYQLNLDGQEDRVYQKYWEASTIRFVEEVL